MLGNSINCPSCGHSFVHGDRVNPHAALAYSETLSDLQDQVRSLDAVILRLSQERVNVLRKVNTICDKTSRLPSEILSHIFQFIRPPIDFRNHLPPEHDNEWLAKSRCFRRDTYHREEDYHFILAGVSYRWRRIIYSTPQLWTTISIGLWKAFTESHISLIDLYSRRAGDLRISMELDFSYHAIGWLENRHPSARAASLALLEPILEAIFTRIAPRIHHLTLVAPPPEIVLNISKDFSLCRSLAIVYVKPCSWSELQNSPAVVMELPCLQRVFLRRIYSPLILPWSSITILELEDMPVSVSFDALTKCLNLVKFKDRRLRPHAPISLPNNLYRSYPIVHENLESMICDDEDANLYRHFRFTRLRTLYWSRTLIQPSAENFRAHIFSNLPSTLISLTLDEVLLMGDGKNELIRLLTYVPQLLELRLFECDYDVRVIELVMQSIGKQPSYSGASTVVGPTILPDLRRLSIISCKTICSEMVIDMLEALSSVRTSERCFHLEVYEIDGLEEASQRVQALVSSGFNVKITTGVESPDACSKELPWW